MNCSSVGPSHGVQSFRKRLLQCGSPTGSQILPSNLLQRGLLFLHGATDTARSLIRVTTSFRHPPALVFGTLHVLQVDICSTMDLHGLQGDNLCYHGLLHRLQGNLYSGAWSTSSPPSSLNLVSAGLFLSHISSPLFSCGCCCAATFSPSYIHYYRVATTITDGLGLGQQWVHLGAGQLWLCWTQWKLLAASHRSHSCSSPATKTSPHKPKTEFYPNVRREGFCPNDVASHMHLWIK